MSDKRKVYTVDFEGVYPVGNCLVIVADSIKEAKETASKTITHTKEFTVSEFKGKGVVEYLSGDY